MRSARFRADDQLAHACTAACCSTDGGGAAAQNSGSLSFSLKSSSHQVPFRQNEETRRRLSRAAAANESNRRHCRTEAKMQIESRRKRPRARARREPPARRKRPFASDRPTTITSASEPAGPRPRPRMSFSDALWALAILLLVVAGQALGAQQQQQQAEETTEHSAGQRGRSSSEMGKVSAHNQNIAVWGWAENENNHDSGPARSSGCCCFSSAPHLRGRSDKERNHSRRRHKSILCRFVFGPSGLKSTAA
jgi:hypothetical protein